MTAEHTDIPESNGAAQTIFLLGGHDLEMLTIRKLLETRQVPFADRNLSWGAKASDYQAEIEQWDHPGHHLVFIELIIDLQPSQASWSVVDHHGPQAGRGTPTSLEQVARMLGVSDQEFAGHRDWQLVAANDRGHVRGMRQLDPPATDDEIRQIRLADLQAQGITDQQLEHARRDAKQAEWLCDGRLTVVRTSGHDRSGLIADVLEPFFGGPGFDNLLVIGADEVGFFGRGELVQGLADQSPSPPDAWYGGNLPEYGYWGARRSQLTFTPLDWLQQQFQDQD